MSIRRQPRFAHAARIAVIALLASTIWGAGIEIACSQEKTTPERKAPARSRNVAPKFEDITLTTRDGVSLRCTFYSAAEAKETVPFILVHDWGKSRGELHAVALWMQQSLKLTVIVPDLRGHGDSLQIQGLDEPIDLEKFKGRAVDSMVLDIEACKSFLLKQNNEGKLNIEQLGILGTGFGASLALKWSVQDWSVRNLPTFKQGQDVKAMILVSPTRSFRGTTISQELKSLPILGNISTLTIVGRENSRSMSDAQRIHKTIERAWGDQSKEAAPFLAAETSLQSTELLKSRGTGVDQWIATFINRRLVQQGDRFLWTDRTSPLK